MNDFGFLLESQHTDFEYAALIATGGGCHISISLVCVAAPPAVFSVLCTHYY